MHRWLSLLLLSNATFALPVNRVATPSDYTCLAVLVTLFMLLFLLVIAKQVFIKCRRLEHPHPPAGESKNSIVGDSFARSSASILPSRINMAPVLCNNGILVGLLGAPTWETRLRVKSVAADSVTWKQQKRDSIIYRLYTRHHLVKNSRSYASNTLDGGASRSISMATYNEIFTSDNFRDIAKLQKNAQPLKSFSGTSSITITRRFSLPSISRKELYGALQSRRSHSVHGRRIPPSDVSTLPSSGNHSVRLVENTTRPEYPPPSPTVTQPIPPPLINHPALLTDNLSSDSHLQPSSITDSSSGPLLSSIISADCYQHSSTPLHISSPYALISKADSSYLDISPLIIKVSRSRLNGVNETTRASTLSYTNLKADSQTGAIRKPLVPINSPPDLESTMLPASIVDSARSAKVKQRPRLPSVRVRRSPPIGPSPLRAMIIPDNPDATLMPHNSDIAKDSSVSRQADHLGMRFLASNQNYDQTNNSSEAFQACNVRQHTPKTDDDPNILLSMIRELAQEAKEWDTSLFMDDKFKSMIQDSALLLSERNENK